MNYQQIADACLVPVANVAAVAPAVDAALKWAGIYSHLAAIGAYATIATETPGFLPVEEFGNWWYFLNEFHSSYEAQYHGRGLIQLSWSSNYKHYGDEIGVNLLGYPALALNTSISAKILALYFRERGTASCANADNWLGVRTTVNGGTNGWARFYNCVIELLKIPDPAKVDVTYLTVRDRLQYKPVPHTPWRADLAAGCEIKFTGKTTPHWAEIVVERGTTQKLKPAHGLQGWVLRSNLRTVEKVA